MKWNDFFKAVKAREYQSVYLFNGPEVLIKQEALKALREALLPPGLEGLNEVVLEGVSAQDIIDAAETLPVMCDRRLVVVRDWAKLLAAKGKSKTASKSKAKADDPETERMHAWLDNPPDSCCVVFYMRGEANESLPLVKILRERSASVEFPLLDDAEMKKWCAQQLKPFLKELSSDGLETLTFMAGRELTRISGELEKLISYTEARRVISAEDVRAVVVPSLEYSVFVILDHLLDGDLAAATLAYNSVLENGQNITMVLASFTRQLRINLHMKYAVDAGSNLSETEKMLDVSPYRARHILRRIQSIPASRLLEFYRACVNAEFEIKSGRLRDRAAMERLMLKIVYDCLGASCN